MSWLRQSLHPHPFLQRTATVVAFRRVGLSFVALGSCRNADAKLNHIATAVSAGVESQKPTTPSQPKPSQFFRAKVKGVTSGWFEFAKTSKLADLKFQAYSFPSITSTSQLFSWRGSTRDYESMPPTLKRAKLLPPNAGVLTRTPLLLTARQHEPFPPRLAV